MKETLKNPHNHCFPAQRYINIWEQKHDYIKKRLQRASTLRLLSFILGITFVIITPISEDSTLKWALSSGFGLSLIAFILALRQHSFLKMKGKRCTTYKKWAEKHRQRQSSAWQAFPDTGVHFEKKGHPYAHDLNIVGQASLYQKINTTLTHGGGEKLAHWLLSEPPSILEIQQRQKAAMAFYKSRIWSRQLRTSADKAESFQSHALDEWLSEGKSLPKKKILFFIPWAAIPWLHTTLFITIITLILSLSENRELLLMHGIILMGILGMLLGRIGQKSTRNFSHAPTGSLVKVIRLLQNYHTEDPWIRHRLDCFEEGQLPADKVFQKLGSCTDALSIRSNFILHIILNAICCWDLLHSLRLEKLRGILEQHFKSWKEAVFEIDALVALSEIQLYEPRFSFPVLSEDLHEIHSQDLSHPLIEDTQRAYNNVKENSGIQAGKLWIITGGNMSGKSTFLRTVGINCVLAQAGAPVCAETFYLPRLSIFSVMKVSDALDQKMSFFQAEAHRIRRIVAATQSNDDKKLLVLLDEVFRGTNQHERRIATHALARTMLKTKTLSLIATHDLSLVEAQLEGSVPVFFPDKLIDGKHVFPHRLEKGVANTTNALRVMESEGLLFEKDANQDLYLSTTP